MINSTRLPRRWPALVGQIGGVWLAALVAFAGTGWLTLLGFYLKSPGLVAVSLVGPLLIFFLVATLTRTAGLLTVRWLPRIGWALLVTLVGTLGAVFYLEVLEASGPGGPGKVVGFVGIGLPFALLTAVLVRHWVVQVVAVAITVATVALGIWLPTTLPPDDAASRIAHANLPGGVLLLATPPDYGFPTLTRKDDHAVLEYRPKGAAKPLSYAPALITRPVSRDQPGDVREGDLVYRTWAGDHLYIRREQGYEVVAEMSEQVPKDAVRAFLASARSATDDEVKRLLPMAPDRRNRDVLQRLGQTLSRLTAAR
ncbi:hypothetical protein [Saccharothrix variisporea]|uniref:hypothetical protein n=1 Tax=Saccharothrix variisporea TaxID=543527 RepID=UPI0011C422CA|nr:hypothetical protein [Saccharothrix variisporea]